MFLFCFCFFLYYMHLCNFFLSAMCNYFIKRNKNAIYEFGMVRGKSYSLNGDLEIFHSRVYLRRWQQTYDLPFGNAL